MEKTPEIALCYYPFYLKTPGIGRCFIIYGFDIVEGVKLLNFFNSILEELDQELKKFVANNKSKANNNKSSYQYLDLENKLEFISIKFTSILRKSFQKHKLKKALMKFSTVGQKTIYSLENHMLSKSKYQMASISKKKIQVHILFPKLSSLNLKKSTEGFEIDSATNPCENVSFIEDEDVIFYQKIKIYVGFE
ncbi:hypothetical protein EDEG_00418 [Edhazardia aedis USNM 41457]|uniref:Uncharacterized protein n=1 Tax=Edhazardia aedis (strain USNM 41457) TaxID=1003232 RepID=J9D165_EDHAE|nr:hypothetical protein EDEG_00418 [Edhazardia aedis USNM 41457]|eukprot:EJW01566.1 hypothetical protein EDEG_00418 [Edhazardia aedis USNM 41457]